MQSFEIWRDKINNKIVVVDHLNPETQVKMTHDGIYVSHKKICNLMRENYDQVTQDISFIGDFSRLWPESKQIKDHLIEVVITGSKAGEYPFKWQITTPSGEVHLDPFEWNDPRAAMMHAIDGILPNTFLKTKCPEMDVATELAYRAIQQLKGRTLNITDEINFANDNFEVLKNMLMTAYEKGAADKELEISKKEEKGPQV